MHIVVQSSLQVARNIIRQISEVPTQLADEVSGEDIPGHALFRQSLIDTADSIETRTGNDPEVQVIKSRLNGVPVYVGVFCGDAGLAARVQEEQELQGAETTNSYCITGRCWRHPAAIHVILVLPQKWDSLAPTLARNLACSLHHERGHLTHSNDLPISRDDLDAVAYRRQPRELIADTYAVHQWVAETGHPFLVCAREVLTFCAANPIVAEQLLADPEYVRHLEQKTLPNRSLPAHASQIEF